MTHPAGSELPRSTRHGLQRGNGKPSRSPQDKSNSARSTRTEEHVFFRFFFDLLLHALCPRQRQVSQAFLPQPMKSREQGSGDRLALISNRVSETS